MNRVETPALPPAALVKQSDASNSGGLVVVTAGPGHNLQHVQPALSDTQHDWSLAAHTVLQ